MSMRTPTYIPSLLTGPPPTRQVTLFLRTELQRVQVADTLSTAARGTCL